MNSGSVGAISVAIAMTVFVIGCDAQLAATPTPLRASPTAVATRQPASPTPTASVTAAPVPVPTMGTTGRIVNASAGYAVTLADGWERIDLTTDLAALFADYLVDQSEIKNVSEVVRIRLQQLFASGSTMYAVKLKRLDPEYLANFNILKLPAAGRDLDALEAFNIAQLGQGGHEDEIAHERLQLPAGEALRLTYKAQSGALILKIDQYLFLANNYQFLLTFGAKPTDKSVTADAADMAKSFEILGAH